MAGLDSAGLTARLGIIIHLSSENAKMNCMHRDEENKPGGGNDVEDDGNGVRSQ